MRTPSSKILLKNSLTKNNLRVLKKRFLTKLEKKKSDNIKKLKKITASKIFKIKYLCTYNNTHISIHTHNNIMLKSLSVGAAGFSNLEKTTRYATFKTTIKILKFLKKKHVKYINLYPKGLGFYKKLIYNILNNNFFIVNLIDSTKYKHNGCKLKKKSS